MPQAQPTPIKAPPKPRRLTVMDVARKLKVRYQKARDLMLTGKLGETEMETEKRMTVSPEGVEAYDAARRKRREARK